MGEEELRWGRVALMLLVGGVLAWLTVSIPSGRPALAALVQAIVVVLFAGSLFVVAKLFPWGRGLPLLTKRSLLLVVGWLALVVVILAWPRGRGVVESLPIWLVILLIVGPLLASRLIRRRSGGQR